MACAILAVCRMTKEGEQCIRRHLKMLNYCTTVLVSLNLNFDSKL